MRVLCVAEKPSIARSITQILSEGHFTTTNTSVGWIKNFEFDYPRTNATFIVTSVSGHLFTHDFPDAYRKWDSCDPFILFDAPIEAKVAPNYTGIATNLKNQIRSCQQLVIWTDCDREGENIGAEIVNVCRTVKPNIIIKRARFSAIIANQIHTAARNPVELDMAQAAAVDARTCLDLRLGAAFTRMQSLALQRQVAALADKMVSYGPCQFPTLGFVVSRFEQVKSFVPETFWHVDLSLTRRDAETGENRETKFIWRRGRLFDFDVAVALYELVLDNPMARVTKVEKKETMKWKPLPLTTVELQKSGSRLLRMAPKKILDVAEKLYQSGFLSYPRTETDQFDPQFDHKALIEKQRADPAWGAFATRLMTQDGQFQAPRRGKKNDQAHPPIHPTAHAGNLQGEEKKVYEYIARRYLGSCSLNAIGQLTTVEVEAGGEDFYATGLIITQRNYLEVFTYDKWNANVIDAFVVDEEFMPSVCELNDGQTSAPSLLTEADLVGLMDKNGIGTDATIATHIQTIIDREYVMKRQEGATSVLVPSVLGIGLVDGYNQIGYERSLSKPQLRRETERRMVQVCEGVKTKEEMLEESIEQYKHVFILARNQFERILTSVRRSIGEGGADDGGDDDNDDGGQGGGRGRGRGRGNPRGRGRGAPPARGRGRGAGGGGAGRGGPPPDGSDDDMSDGPPPAPAPAPRRRPPTSSNTPSAASTYTAVTSSSSSTRVGSSVASSSRAGPSSSSPSGSAPQCRCDQPAVERTVTRESANKGKKFWTCGNNGECSFFEWHDGPSSAGTGGGSLGGGKMIPAKRPAADSSGGPNKRCKCDMTAVSRTVMKDGPNQGRTFWTCPNSENARCGFFEWEDGDGAPRQAPGAGGGGGGASSGGACYKCGESGHFANACTKSNTGYGASSRGGGDGGGGGGGGGVCYKCGEEGHFANACTGGGGGGGQSKSSYGGQSGAKSGECFKCGQTGHWSSDCTSAQSSGGGGRGRGRGKPPSRGSRGSAPRSTSGRGRGKKSSFRAADGY